MNFAIYYDLPNIYLTGGEQSTIDRPSWIEEIKQHFPTHEDSLNQLKRIRQWAKKTFTYRSNQGATIGTLTVNQLYEVKTYYGCHDLAHIFAATARLIGYPCVLVETTSVSWSKAFAKGNVLGDPQGHNLVEIYTNRKWILFDPMSPAYFENYDPQNPHIPSIEYYEDEPEGFYTIAKGKDCWSYGINSLDKLTELQKKIALDLDCYQTSFETCLSALDTTAATKDKGLPLLS
jgi:hypothetical protein